MDLCPLGTELMKTAGPGRVFFEGWSVLKQRWVLILGRIWNYGAEEGGMQGKFTCPVYGQPGSISGTAYVPPSSIRSNLLWDHEPGLSPKHHQV